MDLELFRLWSIGMWTSMSLFVLVWMIWGIKMLSDQEVLQAARVIADTRQTNRQFELFIRAVNGTAPSPIELPSRLRAMMNEMWSMMQQEADKQGVTIDDIMRAGLHEKGRG